MKRRFLIVISLIVFLLMFLLYKIDCIEFIDNYFYDLIIKIKSDNMTDIMKFLTFFASVKFVILVLIVLIALSIWLKKIPIIINVIVIGEVILNNIVKLIVKRDRPKLISLVKETSFSFPSGHTMVSVVLYGFLIYLISKSKINKILKKILIALLSILILLIMISRIYLGVHYFSDILAGFSLALSYLLVVINIIERKKLL